MHKLKYVALHITKNCSHDCSYCYYRGARLPTATDNRANDFPLDTLTAIIDELCANTVEEVYLLGGDPAEHAQFFDLAQYAHNQGLVVTSVSNTHEYNCDPLELSKYLSICESTIHGDNKDSHDGFCGDSGAYDNVLKKLQLYHDLGCTTGITVNVMPANTSMLFSIIGNIINNYGNVLQYVNLQRIAPNGRACVDDDYYLKREHMDIAFSQIEKIASEFGIEIQCEDAFPLCLIPKKYWKFIHRCEWGYEKLSINGDGGVSRCGADPRYNLGNVLKTPLYQIWNESPFLKEFRRKEFLSDQCKKCKNLNICGGGCMIGTWTGEEFATDYFLADLRKEATNHRS